MELRHEDRRENVRVKDRLQLAYKLLGSEDISGCDAESFFPHIWNKYPSYLSVEESEEVNSRILPHIIELHRKIDILAELLSHENRLQVEVPLECEVCISASGVGLNIGESSTPGQKIALCIVLPFVPPAGIFLIGEVTRSNISEHAAYNGKTMYDTGINFVSIKEDDREKLIKYIFKRQRDILRDRASEISNDKVQMS